MRTGCEMPNWRSTSSCPSGCHFMSDEEQEVLSTASRTRFLHHLGDGSRPPPGGASPATWSKDGDQAEGKPITGGLL
eukprot:s720_g22.t1